MAVPCRAAAVPFLLCDECEMTAVGRFPIELPCGCKSLVDLVIGAGVGVGGGRRVSGSTERD